MIIIAQLLWLSVKFVYSTLFQKRCFHKSIQASEKEAVKISEFLRVLSQFEKSTDIGTTRIMYAEYCSDSDDMEGFDVTSDLDINKHQDLCVAVSTPSSSVALLNQAGKDTRHVSQSVASHTSCPPDSTGMFGRGRGQGYMPAPQSANTVPVFQGRGFGLAPHAHMQPAADGKSAPIDTWSHDTHTNVSRKDSGQFDDSVNWDAETNSQQYVLKSYTPKQFTPSSTVNFQSVREANPDVSPKWLASALAQKPLQQSVEEMQRILCQLEGMWTDDRVKDKSHLAQYLSNLYTSSVNPYALTAYLIDKARDSHQAKTTTFTFFVLKEFEKWCKVNRRTISPERYITAELQMKVYTVCIRHHLTLLDMAVKCFHLCYPGNDLFLPQIRKFLEAKKYKEVAVCAGKLGLQNHFSMEQIAVPLILQDKVNVLETFVYGCPEQQQILVQFLDHLCDRETDLDLVMSTVKGLPDIKKKQFTKKVVSKLAGRLMKLYRIPLDLCPNISNARGVGAIKYLLHKRYIEKGFGAGSWQEMVSNAVGDSRFLQVQLIQQLAVFNETAEAARWADEYKLNDDEIPMAVRDARKLNNSPAVSLSHASTSGYVSQQSSVMTEDGEDWEAACYSQDEINAAYHQLAVPLDRVMLVDSLDTYTRCMDQITQPGTIVGMDSEWKPAFGGQVQKVALLQLAVQDQVFLLDIIALDRVFSQVQWQLFIEKFFCSADVLKLGYGIESDLKMLLRTFPFMKETFYKVRRVVNMEVLAHRLVLTEPDPVMFDEDEETDRVSRAEKPEGADVDEGKGAAKFGFTKSEEKGLSELVRRCFGKPLNKSEQMSNWERRPLRQEQKRYAALDAYVLLELYDHLVKLARVQDPSMDVEPTISMKWLKPSKNEKRKARQRGDSKAKSPLKLPPRQMPIGGPVRAPRELRVVVDTMLTGLGKQLRSVGVDVVLADVNADHTQAIEIGRRDNRIVLTSGMPYEMVVASVGPSMCYCVMCDTGSKQLTEVLQHFNIHVQEQDIFSRCQICNGDVYLTIPTQDMHRLYLRKQELQRTDNSSGHVQASSDSDKLISYFTSLGVDWASVSVLGSNVSVQADTVHPAVFQKVEQFYCCARCGKVFWEGSHFERITEQYSHVLSLNPQGPTVYDRLKGGPVKN